MKEFGYIIFSIFYRIFCIFPIQAKKIFLVMTHDAGPEGNMASMRDYIKEQDKEYEFVELHRQDTHFGRSLKKMWHFFIVDAFHFATSAYIFLDNMFLPMSYLKVRKKVKVVQMWHGTGVIKKIGADTNEGKLKELEYRANQNNTHLLVSSETTASIYQQSFSMPKEKVYISGMPRADVFFDEAYQQKALMAFYEEYPMCRDKKLILYAPTFRDSQVANPVIELDYNGLAKRLGEEYVIGLRLHPFVAKNRKMDANLPENVIDFSSYASLNSLLFATDVLISDYSSIIFEFSALRRPMLFFAYDLEEFSENGRGFYWDYEAYVPGAVVRNNEELQEQLCNILELEEVEEDKDYNAFLKDVYKYPDSNAKKRIFELLQL